MRYSLFEIDEVDMITWMAPRQFGIHFYPDEDGDEAKLNDISNWSRYDENATEIHIWLSRNLIYFDHEEDRIMFLLRWV
jgi:hypothetical protein